MQHEVTTSDLSFLDEALHAIDRGAFETGQEALYEGLINLRDSCSPETWMQVARETIPNHALCERIHRDPIARRSFEKPRGYAGDAVLLDYIYGILRPDPSDPVAGAIYAFGARRPANQAVRRRRSLIAEYLDALEVEVESPRVLSVASGHLREAELSSAFEGGDIAEYVALDSDAESCALVASTFPAVNVVEAPFTALYRDPFFTPRFDLVYSAGLYDYLDERVATKLTKRLFDLLAPGGRLLVTNFLSDTVDAGYMESFMGWELILRNMDEISGLAQAIPEGAITKKHTFTDSLRTIGYLELTKRS